MSFISIYITNETEAVAEQLADYLIQNKLAACANIYPIKSMYQWKGKIQKESEWVALVKTTRELWPKIKVAIEEKHPYEVPCIMKTEVEANKAYEDWIRNSVVS